MTASLMGPGDVVLFLSYSGATRDMMETPVSYTHLDVYKRQVIQLASFATVTGRWNTCSNEALMGLPI